MILRGKAFFAKDARISLFYMSYYFSIVSMIRCSLLFVHISRSADNPEIPIGPQDDQIQTVLQDGFLQTT